MDSVPIDDAQVASRPGPSASASAAAISRLGRVAEYASDPIALLDREGRCLYCNRAYGTLFGNGVDLVGTDAFQGLHEGDREHVRQALLHTLRTGEGRAAEFRVDVRDGGIRHLDARLDTLPSADGNIECVIFALRDMTEWRQTEQDLRAQVERVLEVQEVAKLGGFEWNIETNSVGWSPEVKRIFGVDDAYQPTLERFFSFVHPADREWVTRMARSAMVTGTVYQTPYRIVRPDGAVRAILVHARVVRDQAGRPLSMIGALQDVTDRKWAEEQARTSEERFRTIVENVREYAICLLDKAGHVTHWNLGAQRMFAYRDQEILGKHFSCFFAPEKIASGDPARELDIGAVEGSYLGEGWRIRKGGTRFWAQITLTPLFDDSGGLRGFSKITHDITQRKRVEESLRDYADRLRATSQRLVEIQESERRHLSRELHDRVGQNLAAIGIDLGVVARMLPPDANPDLAARIEDSMSLVESTVDTMRDITRELRPPTLDEYGLLSALRSLATGFSRRTGIRTDVSGNEQNGIVPKAVDLAMFRIAQEALNNVARHANARRVEIVLEKESARSRLAITDDGVGFDRNLVEGLDPASRWGLLIMRERAEAIGARFNLNATPGGGVQIFVDYRK